jgi:hypothetical protein
MGIEPTALCLEGRCSTTELRPLTVNYNDPIYNPTHRVRNVKEWLQLYCQSNNGAATLILTMLDAAGIVASLFYGGVLLWAAVSITRHLTRLVRPNRPPHFVALHMTAVWSVGTAATLAALTLIIYALTLIDNVSRSS